MIKKKQVLIRNSIVHLYKWCYDILKTIIYFNRFENMLYYILYFLMINDNPPKNVLKFVFY